MTFYRTPKLSATVATLLVITIALTSRRICFGFDIVGWGRNEQGQLTIPSGLSDVVAIEAGGQHVVALRSNGTVVAWGNNWAGQVDVPPGLTNVKATVAGGHHSVALKHDGTLVAWGYNGDGQINIPPGLPFVNMVDAGNERTLVIKDDGTLGQSVSWSAQYSIGT
jgi:alpha-tubulin suppressor-like RCC1 family protein